jgi:hypothetical protein
MRQAVLFERAEPADAIRVPDQRRSPEMRLIDHAHQFSEHAFMASMRKTVSNAAGSDSPQPEPAEDREGHLAPIQHLPRCEW